MERLRSVGVFHFLSDPPVQSAYNRLGISYTINICVKPAKDSVMGAKYSFREPLLSLSIHGIYTPDWRNVITIDVIINVIMTS
mmetsp:Transcript_15513/g.27509  ORF Transcript_15513/g.27509 Transcript_15513/m.27509 type:complete len:83 (+) Transcript_15513:907-1155(+)